MLIVIFDKIKTKVVLGKLGKGHKFIIIYKIVFPENSKKKSIKTKERVA